MKKRFRFLCVMTVFFFFTPPASAQHDRFAFAITDVQPTGTSWNVLRKLDLKTGQYSDVLFNGADASLAVFDAITKKPFLTAEKTRMAPGAQMPFGTGVAAMAYDKNNNRLYFTPMYIDQLRYLDLKTMKVYFVTDQPLSSSGNTQDGGKIITRMVIAPDGYGYAVSNDATTFIKFSTGNKIEITQLGTLVDDPNNGAVSIHNSCSSWGGDMVADDEGNLYILSARNSVFKITTETKVARLLGHIKGLPQDFTTNGAVVNNKGKIIVSSAVSNAGYFMVDPKNWSATLLPSTAGTYRSSDLANSNFLQTKFRTRSETIREPENISLPDVLVYPNPVSTNQVTLQFAKMKTGKYTIALTDVTGRLVQQQTINVQTEDQTETITLHPGMAKGIYLIKVTDPYKKTTHSQKLLVQ
jgi:hypothetical protein